MNKIVVDCHGADKGVPMVVKGALEALKQRENFTVVLVGNKQEIENSIDDKANLDRVEIVDAPDAITCEDEPVKAIKTKKQSSIVVGLGKLKEDEDCKAFVSAGSTGAVLVGSTLLIGRLKGISRPALCPVLPSANGNVLLLDCGANADCKPINLCHFALMGASYVEAVMGKESPKIALLSNGTEDTKGNQLVHDTLPILKSMKEINFVGNTEGRDVLSGNFDVVVTDGFSGNIELKATEGAVKFLLKSMKKEMMKTFKGKIGGLLLKPTFKKLMKNLDFANQGGAMFLGLKKMVFKAHGSCEYTAITNTIFQALDAVENNCVEKLANKLENTDLSQFNVE